MTVKQKLLFCINENLPIHIQGESDHPCATEVSAPVRSLINVQHQLQTLHFVHNEFEKIHSISVKPPKMAVLRGWGSVLESVFM